MEVLCTSRSRAPNCLYPFIVCALLVSTRTYIQAESRTMLVCESRTMLVCIPGPHGDRNKVSLNDCVYIWYFMHIMYTHIIYIYNVCILYMYILYNTRTHIYICVSVCIYICIYMYIYMCIYIYIWFLYARQHRAYNPRVSTCVCIYPAFSPVVVHYSTSALKRPNPIWVDSVFKKRIIS